MYICEYLSVRIFKNTWFTRFAAKEGIRDDELKALVESLEDGEVDADLGAGVYKQHLARSGGGKSGGYRVIVYYKSNFRTFFIYGSAKSDRDNISKDELIFFKRDAKIYFRLTDEQINVRLQKTLQEITEGAGNESK
jgi:hypothetical protein